jgi:putative membrane protein
MVLDAILAYLHFTSIFLVFSFLTVEVVLMRTALDERMVRLLGRMDLWYFGSAMAALATGFLRLVLGAKGAEFYLGGWTFYAKLLLFLAVAGISVKPTMTYIAWRRAFEADPAWRVPDEARKAMRRWLMIEAHLAALIPVFAVMMSRGLAR